MPLKVSNLTKESWLKNITLRQFIKDEYTLWFYAHRKSAYKTLNRLRACFLNDFGDSPIENLTVLALEQWRTKKLQAGRKINSLNGDIASLKACISKAREWGFIKDHPIASIKLLKADKNTKTRFLSHDEELRLRQALDIREHKIQQERNNANTWRK